MLTIALATSSVIACSVAGAPAASDGKIRLGIRRDLLEALMAEHARAASAGYVSHDAACIIPTVLAEHCPAWVWPNGHR